MKLFDAKRSEQLKLAGMETAADNVKEPLDLARTVAKELALLKPDRCLTSDEVTCPAREPMLPLMMISAPRTPTAGIAPALPPTMTVPE